MEKLTGVAPTQLTDSQRSLRPQRALSTVNTGRTAANPDVLSASPDQLRRSHAAMASELGPLPEVPIAIHASTGGEGLRETRMPATGGHDEQGTRDNTTQRKITHHNVAMTFAQIAIIPRNRANDASAAASSTTARNIGSSSEQTGNIVHLLFFRQEPPWKSPSLRRTTVSQGEFFGKARIGRAAARKLL